MFNGGAIVLEGDEDITVDTGPFGTRVYIRDGRQSLSIELRSVGIAHRLAGAFLDAGLSIRGEKAARQAALEQAVLG